MNMKILLCLLLAMPLLAHAEVYRCKGPYGTTVFQDEPCAEGSAPITVRPATGQVGEAATAAAAERGRAQVERADIQVKHHLITQDIETKEAEIARLVEEMNARLAALREKRTHIMNNPAGVTWEQKSINDEMNAVQSSYDARLAVLREEVVRLHRQREQLDRGQ
jgi:hypothetical protein